MKRAVRQRFDESKLINDFLNDPNIRAMNEAIVKIQNGIPLQMIIKNGQVKLERPKNEVIKQIEELIVHRQLQIAGFYTEDF